jgi:hypothetical protein
LINFADTTSPPSPLFSTPLAPFASPERTDMATKASKAKKPARAPKPTKQSHVPTPWPELKKMWEAGESYESMAKGTDAHYDPEKPDPTKATRAKIWKARNIGVQIDGKLVKFGTQGKAKEGTKKVKPTKETKKRTGNKKASKETNKPAISIEDKAETATSPEQASKK